MSEQDPEMLLEVTKIQILKVIHNKPDLLMLS